MRFARRLALAVFAAALLTALPAPGLPGADSGPKIAVLGPGAGDN